MQLSYSKVCFSFCLVGEAGLLGSVGGESRRHNGEERQTFTKDSAKDSVAED